MSSWIKLKEYNYADDAYAITNIVRIDDDRLILATINRSVIDNVDRFQEYNINCDDWKKCSSLKLSSSPEYPSIAWNIKNKQLYIIGDNPTLEISDIIQINFDNNPAATVTKHDIYIGQSPVILFINHVLHIIGGSDNPRHLIWNYKTTKFDVVHVFKEFQKGIFCHGAVYDKLRDRIFMFGGYDYEPEIWHDSIYQYSLHHNEWTLCAIKLPQKMRNFGYVITSNGKFVILFGGALQILDNEDLREDILDTIYILNLNTMEFHLSNIRCPEKSAYYALLIDNSNKTELIVFGYLRNKCNKFEIRLPVDIFILINKWFKMNWIHLITDSEQHWKITESDILSSILYEL